MDVLNNKITCIYLLVNASGVPPQAALPKSMRSQTPVPLQVPEQMRRAAAAVRNRRLTVVILEGGELLLLFEKVACQVDALIPHTVAHSAYSGWK